MQLNWLLMFEAKTKAVGGKRHPLSDPLEGPEWRECEWALRWMSWLVRQPRPARKVRLAPRTAKRQVDCSASVS